MKKYLFSIGIVCFALIVTFTLIGCGKVGNSPSSVARKFYTALEKGDSKAIGEVMTPEAAQMMAMFMEKAKGMIVAKGGIVKTEEEIDDDTAVVTTTFKDGTTEELNLVKIDGKWKVTIDK